MNKAIFSRRNSDNSIWVSVVFCPNRPLNQYGYFCFNPSLNPGSGTWCETEEQAIKSANFHFERMVEGYGRR